MEAARETLRRHPAFTSLDETELGGLIAQARAEQRSDGEVLIAEGDTSDSVLIVISGTIGVEVATAQGPVPLARLEAPALLGEVGVFARLPRSATVRAIGAVDVLHIPSQAILDASRRYPGLLQHVVLELGARLSGFNRAIGFYTNALAALETEDKGSAILDDLLNPPSELVNFAVTFRRFADQIRQRRQHLREMASAAAIQRAMLPAAVYVDGQGRMDCYAEFRPAREVGGDFYDIFPIDDRLVALTIGDVSGKGIPASLFMAVCQSIMRLTLRETADLGRAVSRTSDFLEANNTQSMFATAFVATIDLETGMLTYCNAGHNPPFLLRADGRIERLLSATGDPPLATWSPAEFAHAQLPLGPGDRIVLFTDGVTESHDAQHEEFGDARLLEILHSAGGGDPAALARAVIEAVDAFVVEGPQFDDLTCVVATYGSINGGILKIQSCRSA